MTSDKMRLSSLIQRGASEAQRYSDHEDTQIAQNPDNKKKFKKFKKDSKIKRSNEHTPPRTISTWFQKCCGNTK